MVKTVQPRGIIAGPVGENRLIWKALPEIAVDFSNLDLAGVRGRARPGQVIAPAPFQPVGPGFLFSEFDPLEGFDEFKGGGVNPEIGLVNPAQFLLPGMNVDQGLVGRRRFDQGIA